MFARSSRFKYLLIGYTQILGHWGLPRRQQFDVSSELILDSHVPRQEWTATADVGRRCKDGCYAAPERHQDSGSHCDRMSCSHAAFVAFAFKDILEKHSIYSSADQIAAIARTAPEISSLVHELQKERGATAGFVDSKGGTLADTLRNQRPVTDKAQATWRRQMDALDAAALSTGFKSDLANARTALDALQSTRSAADSFAVSAKETSAYYTSVIRPLVGIIDSIGSMSKNGEIMRAATALSAVTRRKEFAGQERATGIAGFTRGEFAPDAYRNFLRLGALQDAQMASFDKNAAADQIEFARAALQNADLDALARMRAAAEEAPFNRNVGGVTGAQWFAAATKYIDALRSIEARLADDLVVTVRGIADEARFSFWAILALFGAMLAV